MEPRIRSFLQGKFQIGGFDISKQIARFNYHLANIPQIVYLISWALDASSCVYRVAMPPHASLLLKLLLEQSVAVTTS